MSAMQAVGLDEWMMRPNPLPHLISDSESSLLVSRQRIVSYLDPIYPATWMIKQVHLRLHGEIAIRKGID